jgi:hypothetical protein
MLRGLSLANGWIALLRRETAMEDRQPGRTGFALTGKLHLLPNLPADSSHGFRYMASCATSGSLRSLADQAAA